LLTTLNDVARRRRETFCKRGGMRPILAFGILLLGLNSAAPEPEYSLLFGDYLQTKDGGSVPSLVEIESSTGRSDRLDVAPLQPRALAVDVFRPVYSGHTLALASVSPDIDLPVIDSLATGTVDTDVTGALGTENDTARGSEVSLDDLCKALYTSAQNNDLPVPFFANLIWQESRLRDDVVSKKGAIGIAQFMPQVAAEKGLDDPFDPLQAIPASARFLHELRMQFGNLGFVAAAYNAGARRVAEWLERRGSLPRETRNYVVRVTGLSVDAWRKMPVDGDSLTFVRRLPCRSLPAFASVEQEQSEEAQWDEAKLEQTKLDVLPAADVTPADNTRKHDARKHVVDHSHAHEHDRHEARNTGHVHHTAKREAEHGPRGTREKHKTA
jgi:hypothetical protein